MISLIRNWKRLINIGYTHKYIESLNTDHIKQIIDKRLSNYPLNDLVHFRNLYLSGNTEIYSKLVELLDKLPNDISSTTPIGNEKDYIVTKAVGQFNRPKYFTTAEKIGENLCVLKDTNVYKGSDSRAYYFIDKFAKLERALIRYTLHVLMRYNWKYISVDDIFYDNLMEKCGFLINRNKNQIYNLASKSEDIVKIFTSNLANQNFMQSCLSGTSEMLLVAYLAGEKFSKAELPLRICSHSRCYRREVTTDEGHLFRNHQFDKVEMFAVTKPIHEIGQQMLDEILSIQEELYYKLGLNYRILNIPSGDLGNSAYQKIDIEAWMPGEKIFGEISSASYCTDFQSRKFNIQWKADQEDKFDDNEEVEYVHTLNGTGCAIPRIIKAIVETHQTDKGQVVIPEVLRQYYTDPPENYLISRSQIFKMTYSKNINVENFNI